LSTGSKLAALLILACLLFGEGRALAHQASFTYGSLKVSEDRTSVSYAIRINTKDLYEALALKGDRDATDEEIRGGVDRLYDYLEDSVSLHAAESCQLHRGGVDVIADGERFARLTLELKCPRAQAQVVLDYDLFFDLDELHTGLLEVDGKVVQLKKDKNSFVYELGEPPPDSTLQFVPTGIDHILYGTDHILFLAALLLMAVITRSKEGGWTLRPLREGLAYTGVIVTSFTVAHSMTLIGAALGWFELPGRVVESIIAASIVYVAIENAIRPDPPRRYLVTFLFGLMHGLGFASVLRPLLPEDGLVLPLLAFNVGVELGQLSIVVVVLPCLYGLARLVGAARYRRWVLPGAALLLAVIGGIWFFERAFGVKILGL
jgi:hypothetical protein